MERDGNLYLRLLSAGMIIKDFVKGGGAYDYEIFLRELINQSHFFLEKSGGKGFTAPPSESHGEPDCISEAYTMDFKLADSQSALKARSLLSSCRCIDRNGVMLVGKHSGKMASMSAVRIHSALRHCSMDDLKEIMRRRWDDDIVKHDIKAFLLTLQTRKISCCSFHMNAVSRTVAAIKTACLSFKMHSPRILAAPWNSARLPFQTWTPIFPLFFQISL